MFYATSGVFSRFSAMITVFLPRFQLWFEGGRGGDPFRRPNSKLPSGNNGKRTPLPPGLGNILLSLLFLVGFALLLGAYRGVENIRVIDILLMALVAVFLSRLVRDRISRQEGQNGGENRGRTESRQPDQRFDDEQDDEDEAEAYWRRREEEELQGQGADDEDNKRPGGKSVPPEYDPWDRYRSWTDYTSTEKEGLEATSFRKAGPHDFDHHEFITGAKILFEKVQDAVFSKKDGAVRGFLNDQAAAEMARAISDQPRPQSCSVLAVDAVIKDILKKGTGAIVTVAFNAVVHTGSDDTPREIEAVWRFTRADAQDNWRLDSLQA